MSKKILAIDPKVYRYKADTESMPGEDALRDRLTDQQDTQPSTIQEPADVLLGDTGLLQGRYRLSSIALSHLASILAPGLASMLQNLSGMKRRAKEYSQETYSVSEAIRVLNIVITERFSMLRDRYKLIIDRRNQTVEGVVGPRYRFLSNLEMYQRVSVFVKEATPGARFHEAALDGRRLQLRYKHRERAFAVDCGLVKMEPFYGGWHFSNSELGDCCVKGSSILFRQWSGTSSVRPYDARARVAHLEGDKFDKQFEGLLAQVQSQVTHIPELEQSVLAAMQQHLGLSKDNPDRYEKRFAELQAILVKGGVYKRAAKDTLTQAVVKGSYTATTMEIGNRSTVTKLQAPRALSTAATRTVYDVYNGLCAAARRCHPAKQEHLEQVAHDILTNQLLLVKE